MSGRTTNERLLDAAEKLVAVDGDGAVSSRAILMEAGIKHNSAIDYHFGSRAALINAIWVRGGSSVNDRRSSILAEMPLEITLRQLLHAYIAPFASYVDERSPSYWARFNEDALRSYPLVLLPQFKQTMGQHPRGNPLTVLLEVFEQIEVRTCCGQQPAAGERLSMVIRLVISTFAAWERDAEIGRNTTSATDLGCQLILICLTILEAP